MSIPTQTSKILATLGGVLAAMVLGSAPASAAPVLPVVSTGAVSSLAPTSATLNGSVNPKGTSVTECNFEIGPYAEWLYEVIPCAQALPLSGSSSLPVSLAFTGLAPGSVYYYRLAATNGNGTSQGAVQSFTTLPAVEGVSTLAATALTSVEATLNGSLEPNGVDAHYFFEYGPDTSYGSNTTTHDAGTQSEPEAVAATLTGLIPNKTYHYRLVAENSMGTTYGVDQTLLTSAVAPVVSQFGSTVALSRSSAVLAVTADSGNTPTAYLVEYGSSSAYGSRSAPTNNSANAVEAIDVSLEDLTPGTLYHYRLVASNTVGTVTGPDQTFTTAAAQPPLSATGAASGVGQNNATITGVVSSAGLPTNYGFEIGTGSGYGQPTGIGTLSSGEESIALTLTGLQPGTTYHYRVVASNADGTVYGSEQALTTAGVAVALTVPPAPPLISTPKVAFPSVKAPAKSTAKKKHKTAKTKTKRKKKK
jgi:phosphodiesterase/alkaline phosphatase D-like protein